MEKFNLKKFIEDGKKSKNAKKCGMFLLHNGIVRITKKSKVRHNDKTAKKVNYMLIDYDEKILKNFISQTKKLTGIYYVNAHINKGKLKVGDDIMYVIIGGDIRPNVINALDFLVSNIKSHCIKEEEF